MSLGIGESPVVGVLFQFRANLCTGSSVQQDKPVFIRQFGILKTTVQIMPDLLFRRKFSEIIGPYGIFHVCTSFG
jgi:hypothetical protein